MNANSGGLKLKKLIFIGTNKTQTHNNDNNNVEIIVCQINSHVDIWVAINQRQINYKINREYTKKKDIEKLFCVCV